MQQVFDKRHQPALQSAAFSGEEVAVVDGEHGAVVEDGALASDAGRGRSLHAEGSAEKAHNLVSVGFRTDVEGLGIQR